PAQVRVRGQLTHPVSAAVTRTSDSLDPGTRTILAEVDVPNASHDLLPGMFVYVDFKIAPSGSRFRVPATAIVIGTRGTQVVLVGQDNKLHFQDVTLGRDFGSSTDIQAGLDEGDWILRQPTVALQEGQLVTPRQAPTAPVTRPTG